MTTAGQAVSGAFNVDEIRQDFPILSQEIYGQPLRYFDNAATSQMPRQVAEAVRQFDQHDRANIHRGVHALSMRATDLYEKARERVQGFLNAAEDREIIFVSGTTEGINLVVSSYVRGIVQPGDEIIVSHMEHHSNIVPWQILGEQTGCVLKVAPIDDNGDIDLEAYEALFSEKTKFVSTLHVSNALGTINPVQKIIDIAHAHDVRILLDGAQAVPHLAVDVQALDVDLDFYVFSGHKIYGPTGIGALYGKAELLEAMPPYRGGGDMISSVSFEETTYNVIPYKFEAGTPNISGAVGLAAALDYVTAIGLDRIAAYEDELLAYATKKLEAVPGVRIVGTAKEKASVLSFLVEGVHPHDIGTILDQSGVAIRAGHHCAQPVMTRYGIPATARASFAFYNTKSEIDALVAAVLKVQEMFEDV